MVATWYAFCFSEKFVAHSYTKTNRDVWRTFIYAYKDAHLNDCSGGFSHNWRDEFMAKKDQDDWPLHTEGVKYSGYLCECGAKVNTGGIQIRISSNNFQIFCQLT